MTSSTPLHPPSLKPPLLVLRLSALGDVIHTIPAVMMLREAYDVRWAVEAPYAELIEVVAETATVPVRMKRWGRAPFASAGAIRGALRALRGCETAIDFQGLIKSSALAWLSGARERYGFDRDAIREKAAGVFLNKRVGVDRSAHVIDWNLQLARAVLDLDGPERRPGRSPQQPEWSRYAADPSGRLGEYRGKIVLLPAAGRPEKQWAPANFRQLVDRYGDRALVVWGPGERELAESVGGALAPETDLRELAFILNAAAVVVGGDTGPLHLADALGVPVIGLYAPTDPRRNGPYGQLDRVINHYPTSRTMESITVEEVVTAIEKVLT